MKRPYMRLLLLGGLVLVTLSAMYAGLRTEVARSPTEQSANRSPATASTPQPQISPGDRTSQTTGLNAGGDTPTPYVIQRPEDPVVHLNADANLAAFARRLNTSRDPKREPGPISVPRGVPTFFRAPIAHTPDDLKAGKVDVAFLGAPLDMGSGMRGAGWGPRGLRAFDPRPGGVGGAPDDGPSTTAGAAANSVQTKASLVN